jgi:hypothetical protein
MKNPLEILFGTDMVFRLRRRPSALKRVAGQSKTQLMAALHPDQHLEIGPESAAEVGEAYSRLISATTDEFEQFVSEFLDNQGGRRKIEELKLKVRDLDNQLSQSKIQQSKMAGTIKTKDDEISTLKAKIRRHARDANSAFSLAWDWIYSTVRMTGPIEKSGLSRGKLHHYRIITKGNDGMYWAFEFDITGKIRRAVVSKSLESARVAYLYKSKPTMPDAHSQGPTTKDKVLGRMVIGAISAKGIQSPTVYESLLRGEVIPFVNVGDTLMSLPYLDNRPANDDHPDPDSRPAQLSLAYKELGKVIEILDLKKARFSVRFSRVNDQPWDRVRRWKTKRALNKK